MEGYKRNNPALSPDMLKYNRKDENGNNEVSLVGTKDQIDRFLQLTAKDIISERCRTLNKIPKYHIINSKPVRIQ